MKKDKLLKTESKTHSASRRCSTGDLGIAAIALTLTGLLAGCGTSSPGTVGVVESVNDDGTISICAAEGLVTYTAPSELLAANAAALDDRAGSGIPIRFVVEEGTESEIYPTLRSLSFDATDLAVPQACSG